MTVGGDSTGAKPRGVAASVGRPWIGLLFHERIQVVVRATGPSEFLLGEMSPTLTCQAQGQFAA